MKLHTKLSLAMLSGLILIVILSQIVQYIGAITVIAELSDNTTALLRKVQDQALTNISDAVDRAMSRSMEIGDMQEFDRLLQTQNEVKGLVEFSLYNREGIVTHSSDEKFLNSELPKEVYSQVFTNPQQYVRRWNNNLEVYQPQVAKAQCIECHVAWEEGAIGGVTGIRFSANALIEAEQQAAGAMLKAKRTFLMDSLVTIVLIIAIFMLMMLLLVRRNIGEPLQLLISAATQIANGNVDLVLPRNASHDEIGVLTGAFRHMIAYLQHMTDVATKVSAGDVNQTITPHSSNDALGQAFLSMSAYLHDMADMATSIAQGDLTQTSMGRSADDQLGQAIERMTLGLRDLIEQIRESAEQIARTGTSITTLSTQERDIVTNVDSAMGHVTSTMDLMESSVGDVSESMASLTASVEETSASVTEMSATITEIAGNASELREHAQKTGGSLSNAVESLEQVVKKTERSQQLAQDTMQDAIEGQQAVEHVAGSMNTLDQTMTLAVETMARFEQRSHDIGTVLEVIEEITNQTALLALNASIIAAQAGSHGRGFAVVADEIKQLADRVRTSTKDISSIVETLQAETQRVVDTIYTGAQNVREGIAQTEQARETLQKIMRSAEHSSSVVTEITGALQSVMNTSRDVTVAMDHVNMMTDGIMVATSEHRNGTQQIQNAIQYVNQMASDIELAATRQADGIRDILGAVEAVNTLIDRGLDNSHQIAQTTETLSAQGGALLHAVDRFRLPPA